jgi:LysM repeat protein
MGKLAKQYGTTVDAIVAANKAEYQKISADHIVVGWKLKV